MTARYSRTGVPVLAILLSLGAAAASPADDLKSVTRTGQPNDALACPPGVCTANADIDSPVFTMPADALLLRARSRLGAEPRTVLVDEDRKNARLTFVQRSALFGFPDTVRLQALDVAGGSSVILYSRSDYGYWDFGVNRARLERWLDLLLATD